MLEITATICIPDAELTERFIRAPGPGGQNVNKVATAVQLRFNVLRSPALPDEVRRRLRGLAGRRLDQEGNLTIEAHRFRTRERNREDARERLAELIRQAAQRPKTRIASRPTRASKERRLAAKSRRSRLKQTRSARSDED
ncbi:alternative ribosome rescue aminoacyl-tRNA hydrolase ArfB [Rhabdochromatium marinum]|uniref:alternative ribosome rescue aminoacyl-tRNA hydrolase ArfB n=1 Tax=Rhabdochromatium marinum TaxID=48729 RepID=UPI00190681D3|nr:alternative ribosome rescue aminoacyl-tRNA hydrolase ArfB [Rhabdochromatium marinum]MBK1649019.1 aminoacyl-tRNA hydrolase [Rhabdochromatium marinum]